MSEEEKTNLSSGYCKSSIEEVENIEPLTKKLPAVEASNEPKNKMETHAEELHKAPGHGFKQYFFEFFMLFLAVTLGYFVENIREHYLNKEIEKQSIESVITALASDTVQLKNIIVANEKVVRHLDNLVQLRNADLNIAENKRSFLRNSVVGFSEDWYFITNDAALQQLKSSGSLRLILKQNIIDKIFQPFFTTKPTGQGTGLGLSLSYDIVKAHGGELRVQSKPGEACTFIIELPMVS